MAPPGLVFADEGAELADLTNVPAKELQERHRQFTTSWDREQLVINYPANGLAMMFVTDAFVRRDAETQKAAAAAHWEMARRRLEERQPGSKLGHLAVRLVRAGTSHNTVIGRIKPDGQGRVRLQLWDRPPSAAGLFAVGTERDGDYSVLFVGGTMAEASAFMIAADQHNLRGTLMVKFTDVPVQPGDTLRATVDARGWPVDVPHFDGPVPTMLFDDGFRRDLAEQLKVLGLAKSPPPLNPAR